MYNEFKLEIDEIESDLEMLKQHRKEAKQTIDRKLRLGISKKIRKLRQILVEIRTTLLEIMEIESLFPYSQLASKKEEVNRLLKALVTSVEQYIYYYETGEIEVGRKLTKKIRESYFESEQISEEKKQLGDIEKIEIKMVEDFLELLKRLRKLLKNYNRENKEETYKIKKLLRNIRRMHHQFKSVQHQNVKELGIVDRIAA